MLSATLSILIIVFNYIIVVILVIMWFSYHELAGRQGPSNLLPITLARALLLASFPSAKDSVVPMSANTRL